MAKEKTITVENKNYELIKNYKDGFDEALFKEKYTDYFYDYDYIFGDFSYDKLRLKGFYDKTNKKCNDYNNIEALDSYIKNYCSYECRYFLLKNTK